MTSLITGVGGFAGQHLAAWLLSRDEDVVGVARGSVNWHVGGVARAERFRLVVADVTRADETTAAVQEAHPEHIYHLAAQSSVSESFLDPVGVVQNNVAALMSLLEATSAAGRAARVLVVSSSEVYGRASGQSAVDERVELRPENPYAVRQPA